ncbi:AMP-dependent synthetase and ligase (plasmid) [Rhizobium leguminosarum bv. trifolii WSM2304]|uniref:AMP-dependent synthetase and ligase n=1 Tax=Rhizobium leguminosarum bv. trifolii (strain WSM2304) TaxID=395492 RepID=A0ABF7QYV3_RHILW|nr:acyl-CoA synthetase [Rhizobium leguminosarum]ACI59468.1 AMP-dependent synthetase and ligase [Rhizobium leguminosarum bv. trifolii WSM2304]
MNHDPTGGITPYTTRAMNLANFLSQAARRHVNDPALVWKDRVWTWSEIEARVQAMAYALIREFGIKKGDRILVQSPNCNQMFEALYATFRVGAILVPTNFRQTPDEIVYLAESSGATLMICHAAFAGHAEAARRSSGSLKNVIAIEEADFGPSYDHIVDRNLGRMVEPAIVDRDDPAWFFYTSGTTGHPKAAVLTHGQLTFVINNHNADVFPGVSSADRSLVVAPLSHGAGIHQLCQVARGAATILLPTEKFVVEDVWRLVQEWKVTNLFAVPTIVKMLVEDPSVDTFDHSSLRYVVYAGAPMYREDQKRALTKLGKVLVQYYGLAEVTGAIAVLPPILHSVEDGPDVRIGTCGYERTGMQVQVQDDAGLEMPPGETGEVCVIGPAVFAGYYRNPEANAKSFRDGWFRTGDLGHMDAEGFLYLTGRASDMYISGGSNVYPREIEEKLLQHPGLSEVAILGVPDPVWGEVGIAVCVARDGHRLDGDTLNEWLDGKVARYKLPKRYIIWDALPKSAYGKIAKKLVKAELEARGLLSAEMSTAGA